MTKMEKTRVILDTDANNEIDDQHAIAYLLFSGDIFDMEGIVSNRTFNGGAVDKHTEEAQRVVTRLPLSLVDMKAVRRPPEIPLVLSLAIFSRVVP